MDLVGSSARLVAVKIVNAAIGFVALTYFARALAVPLIGSFFLFQAADAMMVVVADFGLRSAVEKRVSEGDEPNQFFTAGVILKFVSLALVSVAIVLFRSQIDSYLRADLAFELVGVVVFHELALFLMQVLQGELRVGETAVLSLVNVAVYAATATLLLQFGLRIRALVYGLLVGYAAMFVVGFSRRTVRLRRPSMRHVRSLLGYARYNVIWAVGGHVYHWMDVALIGLLLTQQRVAVYEVAWRISLVTVMVSRSIGTTILPQVSAWEVQDAYDDINDLIPAAITSSLFFIIPSFFGVLVLSRTILSTVFGPQYASAGLVLVILMGGAVARSVDIIFDKLVHGFNRPDIGARTTVISVLVNVVLNVVLITQFGIAGAAIATTLAVAVNATLLGSYLSRLTAVRFHVSDLGWCVLSAFGMAVVVAGVTEQVRVTTLFGLGGLVALGAITYFLFVLLSSTLRRKIIRNIRSVIT